VHLPRGVYLEQTTCTTAYATGTSSHVFSLS